MPQITVNYLAVLIAALINIFLGMLWYSPAMFAKAWMASIGKTPEEISGNTAGVYYVINTVASLILAYVLAMFVRFSVVTQLYWAPKLEFGSGWDLL